MPPADSGGYRASDEDSSTQRDSFESEDTVRSPGSGSRPGSQELDRPVLEDENEEEESLVEVDFF